MMLEVNGSSFASLERETGITRSSFAQTRKTYLYKNQKIIADKLKLLPQMIWPERYGKDGQPIKHSPRYPRKDSKEQSKRQCVKNRR